METNARKRIFSAETTFFFWIWSSYFILLADICHSYAPPFLTSSKHWHVFEDDPVGSIVTRLRARDLDDDHVTFKLESRRQGNDVHTYFSLDKFSRVLVAKPLTGLAGDGSKDYIMRVRMNDGSSSTIAEVRLQITKVSDGEGEGGGGGGGGGGMGVQRGLRGRRLGGRRMMGDTRVGSLKSDVPMDNYGIIRSIGNSFGFGPNLWDSHPPLLQVNKTWVVDANAPVGTLVDTIRIIEVSGHGYNLTLQGARGLLTVDLASGVVKVAAPLINQVNDLSIMVSVSNHHGDASELVVFKVIPVTTTSSTTPTTRPSDRGIGIDLPEPIEVRGQLIVSKGIVEPSVASSETSKRPPRLTAYTLICLILMPILAVVCVSSMMVAAFCYCQRVQMRKTVVELESRSLSYLPKP